MGIYHSRNKVKCLILPAQSGKTRKVEELITVLKQDDPTIDIVISANNKLLVAQTTKRMKTDLCKATSSDDEDEDSGPVIKGNVFSWMSGKKTNISSRELCYEIIEDRVEMVIICSHPTRMRYLAELIQLLGRSKHFDRKINIWIDEADASINLWSKHDSLLEFNCLNQVTLFSATFDEVFKRYGRLKVLPYVITHPDCYRCLKDSVLHEEDIAKSTPVGYINHILTKYGDELIRPGTRAFIPGDFTKSSHDEIAELLIENGFAVIILNGTRKELVLPNGDDPIDLRPYLTISDPDEIPDEFNQTLASLYKETNLAAYPFAITGFMCIQRGVTFQTGPVEGKHDGFLFDYAIVPPIMDRAEAYQAMARVFGNVGHLPSWRPCEIYSNSATFAKVQKGEDIAIHLARIVAEEGLEEVGEEHVKQAANMSIDTEWDLVQAEFEDYDEALEFYKEQSGHSPRGLESKASKIKPGFFESSTTKSRGILSYDALMKEIRGWTKTSNFDISKDYKEEKNKVHARMYICYKDLKNPDSGVFIVRILKLRKYKLKRKSAAGGAAAAAGGAGASSSDTEPSKF